MFQEVEGAAQNQMMTRPPLSLLVSSLMEGSDFLFCLFAHLIWTPYSGVTDGGTGGVFSPATFGLGNGFDLSGEQFNTRPEDIRSEYDAVFIPNLILTGSAMEAKRE